MTTPDAVVFDLGNVLIDWDPHPAIAAAVGAEEATRFLGADDLDFGALNREADAGRPWDEVEADAVRTHPHWEPHLRSYRANFALSLVGELADSVDVLRELHEAGTPLFALTNWSAELFPHALERFEFLGWFDDILVSGQERLAKPDPLIFDVLAERSGVPLDRSVFVDDKAENVEAASRAGMDGIVYVDGAQLRSDLRARGLPLKAV